MESGRLELHSALNVITQVAAALDTAHKAGIVHRDIKLENLMLRPDGLVKVLDFGLAMMTELQSDSPQPVNSKAPTQAVVRTDPGMVMGTPRYMSPEQARGQKADARTDIFSLGTVFYEMITGEPPFTGATLPEVFAALLNKDPAPVAPLVPQAVEEIVMKALAKDRETRYQTVEEFSQDLNHFKNEWLSRADSSPTLQLGVPAAPQTSRGTGRGTGQTKPEAIQAQNGTDHRSHRTNPMPRRGKFGFQIRTLPSLSQTVTAPETATYVLTAYCATNILPKVFHRLQSKRPKQHQGLVLRAESASREELLYV